MSAKALFTKDPTADLYIPAPFRIALLPKEFRTAATAVWNALVDCLPKGKADSKATDARLHQSPWLRDFGERFIQKGLWALEHGFETPDNPNAPGMIKRDRKHGRRTIFILTRLRGRAVPVVSTPENNPRGRRPAARPCPPPTPEQQAKLDAAQKQAQTLPINAEDVELARRMFPNRMTEVEKETMTSGP